MTLADAIRLITEAHDPSPERREVCARTRLLIEEITGLSRTQLLVADKDTLLSGEEECRLRAACRRLEAGEPLQYVLGHVSFLDLDLTVAPGVLIPRPETEELCSIIIGQYASCSGLQVLDIGCGSGCIALALAKHLHKAEVRGIELSEEALLIARGNAKSTGLNIPLLHGDIFAPQSFSTTLPAALDIIVSNPPYVRSEERAGMARHVSAYEPPEALFAPDADPTAYYRAIACFARDHLAPRGRLFLEVNTYLAEETAEIVSNLCNRPCRVFADLGGLPRFVISSEI